MKVGFLRCRKIKLEEVSNGLYFLELSGEGSPNPKSKCEGGKYLRGKEGWRKEEDDE